MRYQKAGQQQGQLSLKPSLIPFALAAARLTSSNALNTVPVRTALAMM
jgi:hypothetical protein